MARFLVAILLSLSFHGALGLALFFSQEPIKMPAPPERTQVALKVLPRHPTPPSAPDAGVHVQRDGGHGRRGRSLEKGLPTKSRHKSGHGSQNLPRPQISQISLPDVDTMAPGTISLPSPGNPPEEGLSDAPQEAEERLKGEDGKLHLAQYALLVRKAIEARRFYPSFARRKGLQGKIVLLVEVDGRGQIVDVKVEESSGHPELDRAALRLAQGAGPLPSPPVSPFLVKVPLVYTLR